MNNSFKHDASTSHAETVIRLKGPPQSSHNPVNGLRGQPSNCVHIWTVPTTIKRRVTIPARMACAWSPHAAAVCQTLEQQSREVLAWLQATTYKHSEKGESLEQRAVAQHVDSRQGENRKMASCFKLLGWDQVEDSLSYLARYSPKGSCHRDESSMNHTLAQNKHCEFWCGMHFTCKSTPIIPDRNGSVKRLEKVSKSFHRHSHC